MPRCLVALGSNLGDRQALLADALARLKSCPDLRGLAASSIHETRPVGGPSTQSDYLNAALAFDCDRAPEQLFEMLQQIERDLGRRRNEPWGPRTIDLDLLLDGSHVINSPTLVVPHPRMAFRRFVLEPAAEVAGELPHPTSGWTVSELLARLDGTPYYAALLGLRGGGRSELAVAAAQGSQARCLADPPVFSQISAAGDPTSLEIERPIEFLDARAQQLLSTDWQNRDQGVVSDFYLDQCLAYARAANEPEVLEAVTRRWQSVRGHVVAPRLVVLVAPPAESIGERRLLEELWRLASRERVAPVLVVDPRDAAVALAEVVAAIAAMR